MNIIITGIPEEEVATRDGFTRAHTCKLHDGLRADILDRIHGSSHEQVSVRFQAPTNGNGNRAEVLIHNPSSRKELGRVYRHLCIVLMMWISARNDTLKAIDIRVQGINYPSITLTRN